MRFSLQSIGCGDAFASMGEFQSAHLVRCNGKNILLDCGATVLHSMYQYQVDPLDIDVIVVCHFHGDHIGGFPFLFLKNVYQLNRTKPLLVVGPVGLKQRLYDLLEVMYPGNGSKMLNQEYLKIQELEPNKAIDVNDLIVYLFKADHGNSTEACGISIVNQEFKFVYSGDTSISDLLLTELTDANWCLLECCSVEPLKGHMCQKDINWISENVKIEQVFICHQSEPISLSAVSVQKIKQGEIYVY